MYTTEERNTFFDNTIERLKPSSLVEGIVQLGSGVIGYKDEYSDIDLMIAASNAEDVEITKDFVRQTLGEFNPVYIKEKQLRENVYLLIAFMENSLEFNVSIVPLDSLKVKSPLWKVIVDRTGFVSERMKKEENRFNNRTLKYEVNEDAVFGFVYCALRMEKELRRNNFIYSLKMLEMMRDYTLQVQAMNEGKKLHQFKAYETMDPHFVKAYLSTYPNEMKVQHLAESADNLKELFIDTVKQSSFFSISEDLLQLLKLAEHTEA
ncbi:aminoglycoside 6-adenylyltransferase [Mesobacillus subterraneus]|uniref:aminoglycoside 6-adenylyltransferase n=1 Tax=Mesobacillus subterraneus TaxID=285983 RepID=UPI00203BB921|nr:aminoglycoside 6-adenylyltransferase [Mesobacillus subterraneus]MCM3666089.1 aminoglycoside 6-adenylyltransferase [Mesobacillus subterraneus]MCM3685087.1 aminoglycoside 6-adenylyltransferase [Mesobacillus subterraneus]